jgi:hypothetical protein
VHFRVFAGFETFTNKSFLGGEFAISKFLEQVEVVVFEESVSDDRFALELGESGQVEERVVEKVFPNVVNRCLYRVLRHRSVPTNKFVKELFSLRVGPNLP